MNIQLRIRSLFLALIVLLVSTNADAQCPGGTRLYVDAGIAASGTGVSWAQAYKTVWEALNTANACTNITEVWVKAGTYYPMISSTVIATSRDSSLRILRNNIKLYGGFAGTETTLAGRTNITGNATVLSGDLGVANDSTDNAYHVMTIFSTSTSQIDSNTVVDGFTITDGNATAGGSFTLLGQGFNRQDGGGIYLGGAGAGNVCSPKLENDIITENSANYGGGVYVSGNSSGTCSPVISACTFSLNYATVYGGGLVSFGAGKANMINIRNSTFTRNIANLSGTVGGGAALYTREAQLTMTGCTVSLNKAQCGAGIKTDKGLCFISNTTFNADTVTTNNGTTFLTNGIEIWATGGAATFHGMGDSATYTNCTFTNNKAYFGGAVFSTSFGAAIPNFVSLSKCTFTNNSTGSYGTAVGKLWGGRYQAINCVFTNNSGAGAVGGYSTAGDLPSNDSLTQCVFVNNTGSASGVYYDGVSNFSLKNCTFYNNNGTSTGSRAVYNGGTGVARIDNSIIYGTQTQSGGNAITITNSIVNNPTVTATNSNANPQFSNAANPIGADGIWGTADDGLHLNIISPALNNGSNTLLPGAVTTDFAGDTRIQSTTVDIGAYEGILLACPTGTRLYVDSSRATSGDGSSWAQAYKTVWEALTMADACSNIAEIWVKKGTYYPMSDVNTIAASRDSSLHILRSGLKLYGGFAGTETLLTQRNVATNLTTLSGDINVAGDSTDNSYHVLTIVTSSGTIDSTSRVDGFTIRGGYGWAATGGFTTNGFGMNHQDGAGIMIAATSGINKVQIANCTIRNNSGNFGAGMYIAVSVATGESSPTITSCQFLNNSANGNGGALLSNGTVGKIKATFISTAFSNNRANSSAGAVQHSADSAIYTNCTFNNNISAGDGGAVYAQNAKLSATGTMFKSNLASGSGGGLFSTGSTFSLSADSFANNKAASYGGGGLYTAGSTATMANCVFSGDSSFFGGGVHTVGGTFTGSQCRFLNNNSQSGGGGFYNDSSPVTITSCFFSGNVSGSGALGSGGGFQQHLASANIYNSVFAGNSATGTADDGGGAIMVYGGTVTTEGCTFSENTTTSTIKPNANAISTTAGTTITVQNSIAWGTAANQVVTLGANTYNYSDVKGLTPTATNITAYPQFTNTANAVGADNLWGTADDGLHTTIISSAINAGSNALIPGGITTDAAGAARIQNTTVDMGAYEGSALIVCPGVTRVYVDSSIIGSGDGTSWAQAYKSVWEALTIANACPAVNEIWVKKGTYYPMTTPLVKATSRDSSLRILRNGITIYGGFAGGETTLAARNVATNVTRLSGDLGVVNDSTDNAYHVMTIVGTGAANIDTNTIVDGFTIQWGRNNAGGTFSINGIVANQSDGGGIYLAGSGTGNNCSPIVQNCTFTHNSGIFGAGMYHAGLSGGKSSGIVRFSQFTGNTASSGGGMSAYGSNVSPTITSCSFTGNVVSGNGGAMDLNGNAGISSSVVTSCTFTGNVGYTGGAVSNRGVSAATSLPAYINCTFDANKSINNGGAIYANLVSLTVTGTSITRDTAGASGGGLYGDGIVLTMTNDSVSGDAAAGNGGGILLTVSTATISNTLVQVCNAAFGAGIYAVTTPFTGNAIRFIGNRAGVGSNSGGGGFNNDVGTATLTKCIFQNNLASTAGGTTGSGAGMQQTSGITNLNNCLFTNNVAAGTSDIGGGAIALGGGTINANNTTFSDNATFSTTTPNANTYLILSGATINTNNSIIWGSAANQVAGSGTANYSFSDVKGLAATGNNLNANPLFFNAASPLGADNTWGTTDDGLHLSLVSPALNSGSNALIPSGITTDLAGAVRIQQSVVDMGAYEGGVVICPATARLYVDSSITVSGDGSTWAQAYKTVWEALTIANVCPSVSEVWVKKGTYYPMVTSTIKATSRDSSLRIVRNGIAMYGGFNGTETLLSQRNATTNLTTLSGDLGVVNNATDNAYHVLMSICDGSTQFDTTTVVDGFTITGGNANGPGFTYNGSFLFGADGGAMEIGAYATGGQNKMLLQNCIITGNNAGVAGGIYCGGYTGGISSPTIRNCTISYNTASDVGGIHSYSGGTGAQSQAKISNCRFIGNKASQGGAIGAYIQPGGNSNPTLTNCVFEKDTAVNTGGAINIYGGAAITINNCVFAGNITTNAGAGGGGAINLNGGNTATISGSTFSNNTTASTGSPDGNAISYNGVAATVSNTIIWGTAIQQVTGGGSVVYTNSDVKGVTPTGANLNIDPQFFNAADPDGVDNIWGTADDGVRQVPCSPVVNAGSNAAIPSGTIIDITGAARIQQTTVDMGAYETVLPTITITASSTNPTTCTGTNGSITISGLTTGTAYTINYTKNGSAQTPVVLTATAGTVTITGLTAGSYTALSATFLSCVSGTLAGPIILTDPTAPSAPTLSSNAPICSGTTLTLNAVNVTGGTFAWSGPNTFSSGSQNPTIPAATTAATGSYTATVTVANCTSLPATIPVTVNAIPLLPVLSTNSPVCSGGNLTVSAANVTGGTFAWTGPNSFISGVQSNTINGATTAATGTYIATVTVNNCTSPGASIAAVVNLTPVITTTSSTDPTTCGGTNGTITLNGLTGSTAYTVNFSYNTAAQTPQSLTSNGSGSIVITGLSAGSYTNISVTRNSCTSNSITGPITLNPPATPVIGTTSSTNPTTCGGTSGTITLNGLNNNTGYTVTYLKNGTPQTGTFTSSGTGTLIITGLTLGSYTTVGVTLNNCNSSTVGPFTLTDPAIPSAPVAGSNTPVCQGANLNLTATGQAGAIYAWTGPNTFSTASQNPTVANMQSVNAGTYSVTQTVAGCVSAAGTTVVAMNTVPAQPGTITGNSKICAGSAQTYSITAVANTNTYTWTLPPGWSGTSTTNSINATASTASGIGTITVTANNVCGSSTPRTLADTVVNTPAQPGLITGNTKVCGGSAQSYSITAVPEATTYTWTLPAGWSGTSTTNSISATAASASGIGTITVTAGNFCGTSIARTMADTVVNIPVTPGTITGNVNICAGTSQAYSIGTVPDATTYIWTVPSTNGWTSAGSTTNSINTTAGTVTGAYTITVKAGNQCGTGGAQNLVVNLSNIPAQPGTITGNTNICGGTSQQYNITAVPEATTYTWTVPTAQGWTTTGNTTTTFLNTTAGTGSGNVTVTATNFCGTSAPKALAVTVTNIPATPGLITGNTNVCGGTAQQYKIAKVTSATSYTWTAVGNGWTTATGTPQDTFLNATAGTAATTVTVTATNFCGTGAAQTLTVNVTNIPGQPGTITGRDSLCAGTGDTYSIGAVNEATTYTWTPPTGTGITGTAATNGLSYVLGTTGATPAGTYVLTVKASNGCGTGAIRTKSIVVTAVQAATVSITGTNPSVCSGQPITFTAIGANAGSAPLFQWMKNGLPTGTASATNTYSSTTLSTGDQISVQIRSSATCPLSLWTPGNTIGVTVTPTLTPGVSINSNYPSSIICVGTPVTFSVAATTGPGTAPQYQWHKNGTTVGINSTTYTDGALNTGDSVSVIMTSNYACLTQPDRESNKIGNSVFTTLTPTVSVQVTPGTNVTPGTLVTFTAQTTNVGLTPQYQWFKNGSAIGGATTATYTTSTLKDGDAIGVRVGADLVCANPGVVNSGTKTMTIEKTAVGGYGNGSGATGLISLYPNPTDGRFTVKLTGNAAKEQELNLEVTNMIGQTIYRSTLRPDGTQVGGAGQTEWQTEIGLPGSIASGAYLVRFTDVQGRTMATGKIDVVK